jgi:flavin-dependent dehydrogenase
MEMKTQVVIVGGGPSGTGLAISLKKLGIKSVIVEKDGFPRLHVGESMTGECGASVRALGFEEEMAKHRFPVKMGTMVYGTEGRNSFYVPVMGRDKENKLFPQTAWQVRRSKFDKMMLDACVDQDITVVNGMATDVLRNENGVPCGIKYKSPEGEELMIHSDFVADASGQHTFLRSKGVTSERLMGKYDKQLAIFSHFKGTKREVMEGHPLIPEDTIIFYQKRNHWSWFIPIDDDLVSIGVVTPAEYYRSKGMSKKDFLLSEMQTINPELTKRVENVEMIEDVHSCANYSYQIKEFGGPGFLCVGDAHRFIDPIFSLGMHFTLVECRKAADAIADYLGGKTTHMANPFKEHMEFCELGMDNVQVLLDVFWDYPFAFSLYMKDAKYRDGFIDLFAGRCYVTDPPACITALRKLQVEKSNQEAMEA